MEKPESPRTEKIRRLQDRNRVLLEVTNATVSRLDRASLFAAVSHALLRVVDFDWACLTLLDSNRDVLRISALKGGGEGPGHMEVGTVLEYTEPPLGPVIEEGVPLLCGEIDREPVNAITQTLRQEGVHSYMCIPLPARGRVIGTLIVGSRRAEAYSKEQIYFMEEVGKQVALAVENMRSVEKIDRLRARLEEENRYLQEEIKTEHNFEEIVGRSRALKATLRDVEKVAPTEAGVLVTGETGTGKELIARAVHNLSRRREKPLVTVHCAAIPGGLVESELFGHEKGAFTGAVERKMGRFELADGGTIFLDEVGELPLETQTKLLRVLQEGEVNRVGGGHSFRVDVRLIAATNRDLEAEVKAGRFRADLFYRLNVFPIRVPPLRDRMEDLPLLARYFVDRFASGVGRTIERIDPQVTRALKAYDWPGNVRELAHVLERGVILSGGSLLESGDWLPRSTGKEGPGKEATLEEVERQHILRVLRRTKWRVSGEKGAARILGLKRTTLESRMKKLGIRRPV